MSGRCVYCNKPLTTGDLVNPFYENTDNVCTECDTAFKAPEVNAKKVDFIERYAKHLAKKYPEYMNYSYHGKNGADSDNEKGFWRGMAMCVASILNDLKQDGIIAHSGLHNDTWPTED
jgi:hypothetical protein